MTLSLPSSSSERTRQILEDLEAVRENLLALSDDIWKSIDHNDPAALDAGVEFKRSYNAKVAAFDQIAADISSLVQQYTSITLEAGEETGALDREHNERIIAELNREEPHTLDEDFTFKRPHGFILDGQGTTGITTWRRLFELVCKQLLQRDVARFRALPENPDFISNRGKGYFSRSADELRYAWEIEKGLYAEVNLSANGLKDMMRRLLKEYELPTASLRLFLREDRDAGRNRDE
jgi:EAL domain-containing protein (putative c-di-GMP-specific phosphodiesterase class I)